MKLRTLDIKAKLLYQDLHSVPKKYLQLYDRIAAEMLYEGLIMYINHYFGTQSDFGWLKTLLTEYQYDN